MKTKNFTLGPGALERITLQLAKRPYRGLITDEPKSKRPYRIRARVVGYYTVYCGYGDHTVVVDMADEFPMRDDGRGRFADVLAAYEGDENAAYRVASELVDESLEGWFDPCSDDEDGDL